MKTALTLLTAATLCSFQVVEDQAKLPLLNPELSERKVGKIILDNGLQVYLISDPGAQQSAAGLAVEAGSWQDPKEYPGTAHFLEHMLFMGTQAFPEEHEYMQYVHENGGNVNAFTASDRTVYMFSINNDAFKGALERLAHFFIDPLFSTSGIGRELHAVDQEHSKNIENDNWRLYMIFKETSNPNHPHSGFSTGNAKTLSGIPQSVLKDWYKTYYLAHKMHLAMISTLPLDEMIALAVQNFSAVPDRPVKQNTLPSSITSEKQLGHFIYIQPIKDIKQLSLLWEIPHSFAIDKDRKAPELTAFALQSSHQNSLIEELKREGLAESIRVSSDRFSKDTVVFSIDLDLTDQGIFHVNTVIERIFQALARLQKNGIPSYIFDQMQTMSRLNYQYQGRDSAFNAITRYASDMIDEPLTTYPEKLSIPSRYDPTFISDFIKSLEPHNCIYFLVADPEKSGVKPDMREKWMNAAFAIRPIPSQQLITWQQAPLNPSIELAKPNPYLPKNLALVAPAAPVKPPKPELISVNSGGKIYYALDTRYKVPKASTSYAIRSPLFTPDAKSNALASLYLRGLDHKLAPLLSEAGAAGLNGSFGFGELKLTFLLGGYSEKLPLFTKNFFSAVKEFGLSPQEFELLRASLIADFENTAKELPVKQASDLLDSIVFNDAPLGTDKADALKTLSYAEFQTFTKELYQKTYLESLLYGNLSRKQAIELSGGVRDALGSQPYRPNEQVRRELLLLPNHGPYLVEKTTSRQGNGVILLLQEGPFTFERRSVQQVLSVALQDAFFETLRTKQQTGYIAKSWDQEIERQLMQSFAVQSITHQPAELLSRFELFIEDFDKNLRDHLPPEKFETIRSNLITTLEQPPENLYRMAARLNLLAFTYDADFHWIDKRIESLKALTYDQFEKKAHEMLSRNNEHRLAVMVEGVLPPENTFRFRLITSDQLRSQGTFVSSKE